jgi:transcription elongation factor GreA
MEEVTRKLRKELEAYEFEFRVELPKEIGAAVALGDLSENAEYHAALERQAFLKARIAELRERLGALSTLNVSAISRTTAGLGSTIKLLDLDTDDEIVYELVLPEVADLDTGLISIASPVARSIVGKQAGDEFTVKIPSGTKNYEVLELKTLHDKSSSTEK